MNITTNTKPLAADAMADLCKFIEATRTNPSALTVWNEYLSQERPVIDVIDDAEGKPVFILSKTLASFVTAGVAA